MRLTKQVKAKCDNDGCKNKADYSLILSRCGIKSKINICHSCLKALYAMLGDNLIPKSIETIKKTI